MVLVLVPQTDPILHKPVEQFNWQTPQHNPVELFQQLKETMIKHKGLGLSANQVGLNVAAFVYGTWFDEESIKIMINPVIVYKSDEQETKTEGCLSYPGLQFKVKRPKVIRVRFTNQLGETDTWTLGDMDATVVQHEVDHLNGIVFTKRANRYHVEKAKKDLAKILKLKAQQAAAKEKQENKEKLKQAWFNGRTL